MDKSCQLQHRSLRRVCYRLITFMINALEHDISDFKKIQILVQSLLEDLKALADELHRRDMVFVYDIVLNHVGPAP